MKKSCIAIERTLLSTINSVVHFLNLKIHPGMREVIAPKFIQIWLFVDRNKIKLILHKTIETKPNSEKTHEKLASVTYTDFVIAWAFSIKMES